MIICHRHIDSFLTCVYNRWSPLALGQAETSTSVSETCGIVVIFFTLFRSMYYHEVTWNMKSWCISKLLCGYVLLEYKNELEDIVGSLLRVPYRDTFMGIVRRSVGGKGATVCHIMFGNDHVSSVVEENGFGERVVTVHRWCAFNAGGKDSPEATTFSFPFFFFAHTEATGTPPPHPPGLGHVCYYVFSQRTWSVEPASLRVVAGVYTTSVWLGLGVNFSFSKNHVPYSKHIPWMNACCVYIQMRSNSLTMILFLLTWRWNTNHRNHNSKIKCRQTQEERQWVSMVGWAGGGR